MSSLLTSLETIGAILSFKSDTLQLEKKISNNEINWENIVKVGSQHLVLPALYCGLHEKKLLQLIPEDLSAYLAEITSINRNRNLTILNEVKQISQLFHTNNIDHVFLKGSALLAANYYDDLGARMIGDIDILVAPNQLQKAHDLLIKEGYKEGKTSFGYSLTQHKSKHLNRLVKKTELGDTFVVFERF